MEESDAVSALAALAHPHRLRVFRMLIEVAPAGLAAGRIAGQVGVPASTLSTHLAQLERAGLLRSWRVARNIFYAVNLGGSRDLIGFLVDDCCGGHPDLCGYRGDRPSDFLTETDPKNLGEKT